MPRGRTEQYMIWKACERFNILPPDVQRNWIDNNIWSQSLLMGYNSIRDQEIFEEKLEWTKANAKNIV